MRRWGWWFVILMTTGCGPRVLAGYERVRAHGEAEMLDGQVRISLMLERTQLCHTDGQRVPCGEWEPLAGQAVFVTSHRVPNGPPMLPLGITDVHGRTEQVVPVDRLARLEPPLVASIGPYTAALPELRGAVAEARAWMDREEATRAQAELEAEATARAEAEARLREARQRQRHEQAERTRTAAARLLRDGLAGFRLGMSLSDARAHCRDSGGQWDPAVEQGNGMAVCKEMPREVALEGTPFPPPQSVGLTVRNGGVTVLMLSLLGSLHSRRHAQLYRAVFDVMRHHYGEPSEDREFFHQWDMPDARFSVIVELVVMEALGQAAISVRYEGLDSERSSTGGSR